MRNRILIISGILVILLFSSINKSYAQDKFVPETYAGIRVSYGVSRVGFDPVVDQQFYPGLGYGIALSHISQKNLGIYTEINFAQAGWKTTSDSTGNYSRRLNYLQIPLLTQFNIGNRKSKVLIHIGPCISFLLSESESIDTLSGAYNKPFIGMSVKNTVDYGLCADLGYIQQTGIGAFQLVARYNQSLGSIFESSGNADYRFSMNSILEIGIGYFIEPRKIFKKH